jgi:hypothetical protein
MGYREAALPAPKPQLHVDGADYDVDFFGMDDGRDDAPDAAFRFLFQLGQGLMIYLYVVQAGGRQRPTHFFHTFWLKDCAVAEVDMEDRGPPTVVRLEPCALPLNYAQVTLGAKTFTVRAQRFSAPSAAELRMDFELEGGAQLRWTRAEAWSFVDGATSRALAADEWPRFGPVDDDAAAAQ